MGSEFKNSKKFLKRRRVEGLPSFLLDLRAVPEDVSFPPRPTISDHYLGPVFFGQCNENHPPLHSINFSTFRHVGSAYFGKENIKDLFLPKTEVAKPVPISKPTEFKPVFRRTRIYSDPFKHKCPGTRRTIVHEVKPPVIDLGETTSVIEGETILEIPLYRLKKVCSGAPASEFELVNFSDVKEKERIFMPYKERISHIHFPKEFATVTVVGPTIPAAITITKLPSKRKKQSVSDLLNPPQVRKSSKDETNEMGTDENKAEPESNLSVEEGGEEEGFNDNEKNLDIQITEEEEVREEEQQEQNLQDVGITEETTELEEINDEEMTESDVEQPAQEIIAEEMEVIEKTEEQEEENLEEEDPGN